MLTWKCTRVSLDVPYNRHQHGCLAEVHAWWVGVDDPRGLFRGVSLGKDACTPSLQHVDWPGAREDAGIHCELCSRFIKRLTGDGLEASPGRSVIASACVWLVCVPRQTGRGL